MSSVLAEAYGLVEDGIVSEEDFQDFVFTNPVKLLAGMNPDFFEGTTVEAEAGAFMKETGISAEV